MKVRLLKSVANIPEDTIVEVTKNLDTKHFWSFTTKNVEATMWQILNPADYIDKRISMSFISDYLVNQADFEILD